MQLAIVVLAVFYLGATMYQFTVMSGKIERPVSTDLEKYLGDYTMQKALVDSVPYADKQLITQAIFEAYTVQARQQNMEVLLMSRTWIKYLGFITGMILCIVGCVFILGKLNDEQEHGGEGEVASIKLSIKSHSPGIMMAFLGTILILATIVTQQQIEKADANTYLSEREFVITDTTAIKNALSNIDSTKLKSRRDSTKKPPIGF